MNDLTARLRATYRDTYVAWLVDPTISINARCNEAADRIDALEAEVAALESDVAALDELNITLEAECDRLEAETARLRSYWAAHVDFGGDMHFVKPGQAVRPDGVVCDLVEATDETAAFDVSHVIDRITTDRAWILRPVVLPEGGTS